MKKASLLALSLSILLLSGCGSTDQEAEASEDIVMDEQETDLSFQSESAKDYVAQQQAKVDAEIEAKRTQPITPIETVSIDKTQESEHSGLSIHVHTADIYDGSNEISAPDYGRYIVVRADMINNDPKEIKLIGTEFQLEAMDLDGLHDISSTLHDNHYKNFPDFPTLKPGETIQADFAFDLPPSSTYEFTYHDLFESNEICWNIQFQTDQPKE